MFIPFTVTGLAMGMVYALLGMGLILLIRAVGVMNFAQGDLLMAGAYITFMLATDIGLPPVPMLLAAVLVFAVCGAVFMAVCYLPVRNSKWPAATMICTLGASMVIRELLILFFSAAPKVMDPIVPGLLKLGSVVIEWQYIAVALVGVVVVCGVFLLFDKLYCGRVMQAASQDRYAAELLGIPINLTILATYIIVMAIAGIGGYLVAPVFMVTPTLGVLQMRAFAGVVIGGFGSLKGAVYGSVLVGLIESYATYFTSSYKDVVVFAALIVMLAVRPQGLFGETIAEKA
jgi:branched-chain amino acid transport system permease protein